MPTPELTILHIGAARAVLISTLGPMLTLVFGWILLNETITLLQVVGMSFVMFGILVLKRK